MNDKNNIHTTQILDEALAQLRNLLLDDRFLYKNQQCIHYSCFNK